MTTQLFTDYDAYAAAIGEASLSMRLTSLKEMKWALQWTDAGSIRLQKGFEGGGSIAEGATFADGWVFYHQCFPGQTNGETTSADDVFVAPPGSEFCLTCHPLHEWLTIFIPTPLLFSSEHELEFSSSARPQLLKPPPHLTRKFTSLARRFLATAESRTQLLGSELAVKSFQREFLATAKELIARNQNTDSRNYFRWRNQANSTVQLARSRPDQSVSLSDLARQIGVPERTLRTAFQRCYGLSPMEYLRIQRLHQARQILRESHPEQTTVTQVALDLGFWDLGRFAGAYRRLFGELPSKTLRRRAQQQLVK